MVDGLLTSWIFERTCASLSLHDGVGTEAELVYRTCGEHPRSVTQAKRSVLRDLQQPEIQSGARVRIVLVAFCVAALFSACAQEPQRDRPIDRFNHAEDLSGADVDDTASPDTSDDTDVDDSEDTVADVADLSELPDLDDSTDTTDALDAEDSTDVDDSTDIDDGDDAIDSDATDGGDDTVDGDTTDPETCERWDVFTDAELRGELAEYVTINHEYVGSSPNECYRWARNYMYGVEEGGLVIDQPIDVFDGNYEGVYTGVLVPYTRSSASRTPGNILNTEHSWPQSDGADGLPEKCDIHHLFPAHENVNSTRSNDEFGETACGPPTGGACSCCDGGSESGTSQTSSDTVFQVRSVRQGDIARAHFYFAVRYGYDIDANEESVLRAWNIADPVVGVGETVPSREQIRNDRIEAVQKNRNPFVDCPGLVDRISDF